MIRRYVISCSVKVDWRIGVYDGRCRSLGTDLGIEYKMLMTTWMPELIPYLG